MSDNSFYIRPAGRHIAAIGAGLIKDQYAALVELVKNSYDADATVVEITFSTILDYSNNHSGISIEVNDNGHGMDFQTVTTVWMTPSTDNKLLQKSSKNKNRFLQGRKGIGRYAVSMLGDELILETVDPNGEKSIAYINWAAFEEAEYLGDVPIEIDKSKTVESQGTKLLIQGKKRHLDAWNKSELDKLLFELKKLLPPSPDNEELDDFSIYLSFDKNFWIKDLADSRIKIDPFPLFEYYHYRVWGNITSEGIADLKFHNPRAQKEAYELKSRQLIINPNSEFPGRIEIDFRVYDRDSESINFLLSSGLEKESIGKREAKRLIDSYNGIGVYRNGFRIRPLGDSGNDWLDLDKIRVQSPSRKIGSNQVIGFVHIQSEEESGLEETSARDGLRENREYLGLKEICRNVLELLERERFSFRKSVGLSRSKRQLNSRIEQLFEFSTLKNDIISILHRLDLDQNSQNEIVALIDKKQASNNQIADDIQRIVATYQGQATVGKIVDIVMHEGRRALHFFRNEAPRLVSFTKTLEDKCKDDPSVEKIIDLSIHLVENSKSLDTLFKKINPLGARRVRKKEFNLINSINTAERIFQKELQKKSIAFKVDCSDEITIFGWKADLDATFVNLIDNSVYWLDNISKPDKQIQITVKLYPEGRIEILFEDNGPGIDENLIESQDIFEPDFTTKPESGSGLGLAIAGEAVERNNGTLVAEYPLETGARFKIIIEPPQS